MIYKTSQAQRERATRYYKTHREQMLEYKKKWALQHLEQRHQSMQKYYRLHKEEERIRGRHYRQTHQLEIREYQHKLYLKNKVARLEYIKKRYLIAKVLKRKRRLKALELLGNECYICGTSEKTLHFHHRVYGLIGAQFIGNGNPYATVREALEHPEYFKLLCPPCHQVISRLEKSSQYLSKALEILGVTEGRLKLSPA